ncbi:MAG: hypothetical protein V1685_01825 [Parcubacteria group bacterium]
MESNIIEPEKSTLGQESKKMGMKLVAILLTLGLFIFSFGAILYGLFATGDSDPSRSSSPEWIVYAVVIGAASIIGLILILAYESSSGGSSAKPGFSWRRLLGPIAILLVIAAIPIIIYLLLLVSVNP